MGDDAKRRNARGTNGDQPTAAPDAPGGPAADPPEEAPPGTTGGRVLRFARRIMDGRDLAEDTKVLLHAVLSTSDKVKTDAVRMVAREVRNYLSELRLKEDMMELARSHSLEISISLKPLADAASNDDGDDGEGEA